MNENITSANNCQAVTDRKRRRHAKATELQFAQATGKDGAMH